MPCKPSKASWVSWELARAAQHAAARQLTHSPCALFSPPRQAVDPIGGAATCGTTCAASSCWRDSVLKMEYAEVRPCCTWVTR